MPELLIVLVAELPIVGERLMTAGLLLPREELREELQDAARCLSSIT